MIAGVLIGRWFNDERKKLKTRGEPWHQTWLTPPGILIIIVLCALAVLRWYIAASS
jgi:hypothetical protein